MPTEKKILLDYEIDTVFCALQLAINSYKESLKKATPPDALTFRQQIKNMKLIQDKLK